MTGIYKITNLLNNKIYIGQSVNIKERWKNHVRFSQDSKNPLYNNSLYKEIREYGSENFELTVIEECEKDDLNQRERYWINFYDSTNPEIGYNLCLGGGYYAPRKVYQYDLDGNFIKEYDSISIAALKTNSNKCGISSCCNNRQLSCNNYQWSFELTKKTKYSRKLSRCKEKPVFQYTLDGEFVKEFRSISEAARLTNNYHENISSCANKRTSSCGGYVWSFDKVENLKYSPKQPGGAGKKKVYQYTLDLELIAIHESIASAAKATGSNSSGISLCCSCKIKKSNGFIWSFVPLQ